VSGSPRRRPAVGPWLRHAGGARDLSVLLVLVLAWWFTLRPTTLGGPASYVAIRGDSMQPVYEPGDLVVLAAASEYSVGDVVAYRVPDGEVGEGRLVVHRIVGGEPATGYIVQGDNNQAPDPWRPGAADIAGTSWVRLPGVGRAIALIHQPAVAGALAVAVLVAALSLRSTRGRPVSSRGSAATTRRAVLMGYRRRRTRVPSFGDDLGID
jgi:signal peptidase